MDAYIYHFIDELIQLWVGITLYNVSKSTRKKIQFHIILTWTIHDASQITHFFVCKVFHFNSIVLGCLET
jgi:hypothetical protein